VTRVWVTRARPGAEATAARLATLGFEPLVAPLLAVRHIPGGEIDLADVTALAFTSANGVAAFAARSAERRLPVFAVGAATAAAARGQGFADVVSADGDVAALARAIGARGAVGPSGEAEILHPGPADPAGDLVGDLRRQGFRARAVTVYETAGRAPDAGATRLVAGARAVLLHSTKAARALAAHLTAHPAPHLFAACLSDAVAAPLAGAGLAEARAAAEPTEAALLDLLRDLRADSGPTA
jgi:uroporphyrinogen-III synthase